MLSGAIRIVIITVVFLAVASSAPAAAAVNPLTVVIDAAHGGFDNGVAVSQDVTEKEITLDVARAIRSALEGEGKFKVLLTRDSDKDMSVVERRNAVTQGGPALFISIHVNAGFGQDASGYEIYVAGREMQQNENTGSTTGDTVRADIMNESVRFAKIVQRNLNEVFPREGRGVRNAPVALLSDLAIPGVVLEIGFATNAANRKKVQGQEAWAAIARQLSLSIREYFAGAGE